MSLDVAEFVVDLQDMADRMSDAVQSADGPDPFGAAAPPDLVQLLGGLYAMQRFGNMLGAQVCDALTAIAVQASGG